MSTFISVANLPEWSRFTAPGSCVWSRASVWSFKRSPPHTTRTTKPPPEVHIAQMLIIPVHTAHLRSISPSFTDTINPQFLHTLQSLAFIYHPAFLNWFVSYFDLCMLNFWGFLSSPLDCLPDCLLSVFWPGLFIWLWILLQGSNKICAWILPSVSYCYTPLVFSRFSGFLYYRNS